MALYPYFCCHQTEKKGCLKILDQVILGRGELIEYSYYYHIILLICLTDSGQDRTGQDQDVFT